MAMSNKHILTATDQVLQIKIFINCKDFKDAWNKAKLLDENRYIRINFRNNIPRYKEFKEKFFLIKPL